MYLLDTHVLLWWLSDPSKLSQKARDVLEDTSHIVFVSTVSVWEIAIKSALGKVTIPKNFFETLDEQHFEELPITHEHAADIFKLPSIHNDPFDRLLIAQAREEKLTFITADKTILKYPDTFLKAST